MRRLLLLAVTACIAGLLLTSCDDPFSPIDGSDSTTEELIGPTWHLIALRNSEGERKALNSEEIYTLGFGVDGAFSGRADCNSYFGGFDAKDGGYLSVDSLGTTEVYCGEDSHYETYMKGVHTAQAYEVRDGHLRIGYERKGVLMYKRIKRKEGE